MVTPLTYLRTVRHLRGEQILARLVRALPRRATRVAPAPPLRARPGSFGSPILRPGPIRRGSSFSFLNRTGIVAEAADWNDARQQHLWLYNLHYFDWLRETAASTRTEDDAAWIDKWIAENPIGRGPGWEPYPASLRIVNWTVWFLTVGGSNEPRLASLAAQTRHLARSVEYHLLGNHLFANAKALIFAGNFFESAEADRWRTTGLSLLARELREQILPDGAHFELNPMYLSLILEDCLELLGLDAAYPNLVRAPFASLKLGDITSKMVQWLRTMLHPDGEIPYFNDAAFGVAPSPSALFEYSRARNITVGPAREPNVVLQPSGYGVLSRGPFHLIFDGGRVGPDHQPGHAHADTLSFELSVGEERVITTSSAWPVRHTSQTRGHRRRRPRAGMNHRVANTPR